MQNGYEDHPPGPGYANLPSHSEDMRRLIEESTAGKEAARVLSEALVYSRPEELELKPIIRVRTALTRLTSGILQQMLPRPRISHEPDGLGSGRSKPFPRENNDEWFITRSGGITTG